MFDREILKGQLREDFERLSELVLRVAQGEIWLKRERDLLEGAVEVKILMFNISSL